MQFFTLKNFDKKIKREEMILKEARERRKREEGRGEAANKKRGEVDGSKRSFEKTVYRLSETSKYLQFPAKD